MHTSNFAVPPHSNFAVPHFFDISIIYAKYLAHNVGSATEMIINITLVDDFITFNISNYKPCQSNYNLTMETTIYQNKALWQDVFQSMPTGPSFSDYAVVWEKLKLNEKLK